VSGLRSPNRQGNGGRNVLRSRSHFSVLRANCATQMEGLCACACVRVRVSVCTPDTHHTPRPRTLCYWIPSSRVWRSVITAAQRRCHCWNVPHPFCVIVPVPLLECPTPFSLHYTSTMAGMFRTFSLHYTSTIAGMFRTFSLHYTSAIAGMLHPFRFIILVHLPECSTPFHRSLHQCTAFLYGSVILTAPVRSHICTAALFDSASISHLRCLILCLPLSSVV
jgi:hypothetical protein